jgi:hypothetical protein
MAAPIFACVLGGIFGEYSNRRMGWSHPLSHHCQRQSIVHIVHTPMVPRFQGIPPGQWVDFCHFCHPPELHFPLFKAIVNSMPSFIANKFDDISNKINPG